MDSSEKRPVVALAAGPEDARRLHLELVRHDPRQVLTVDLGAVPACGPETVDVLRRAADRHTAAGGGLRLLAPSAPVARSLQLAGLGPLLVEAQTPGGGGRVDDSTG
jgi:anti-anti-sigma regulatory factor